MHLTLEMLDALSARAKMSERLRVNFNLHENVKDPVQRLLNAMEPGTIVPVHRHLQTAETIVLLRGKLKVVFYDDEKKATDSFLLEENSNSFGIHIPKGIWHGVEILKSGTVIFEVKEGPYEPLRESDVLS